MMKIKFSLSKDRGEKHKERIPTLHTTSALTIDPGQDLWPIVKRMACDNSGREMKILVYNVGSTGTQKLHVPL